MKFPVIWQTVLLLSAANVFMTFAWYGHLKHLNDRPWWIAALISYRPWPPAGRNSRLPRRFLGKVPKVAFSLCRYCRVAHHAPALLAPPANHG